MRRREFITLLGGGAAALAPIAALAQQPAMPVIGFLHSAAPSTMPDLFHKVLSEAGYVEGHNVAIERRYAEGHYDRLPGLAAELVRSNVSLLCAFGHVQSALAAKAATETIPILFAHGSDPVRFGLVASLNRPGGNITGITYLTTELEPKRLGLLHELVPQAGRIAVLLNPANANANRQLREVKHAAHTLGLRLHIVDANGERDYEAAFTAISRTNAEALLVAADPLFFNRRDQLVALAARHSIPAIYDFRSYAEAGGLASYGTDLADAYRQVGIYVGRILRGEKPADLPVIQSSRFEFVINLKTAKRLGLHLSPTLLARADEVIE